MANSYSPRSAITNFSCTRRAPFPKRCRETREAADGGGARVEKWWLC